MNEWKSLSDFVLISCLLAETVSVLHVYSSARASLVDLNGIKALAQEALRLLAVIAQWMNVNLHHITDLQMEKKKPQKT